MFLFKLQIDKKVVKPVVKLVEDVDMSYNEIATFLFLMKNGTYLRLVQDELKASLSTKELKQVNNIYLNLVQMQSEYFNASQKSKEVDAAQIPIVDSSMKDGDML